MNCIFRLYGSHMRRSLAGLRSQLFTMKQASQRHVPRGFTLIELLIVVSILGIIGAVAIPVYMGYVDTARATAAQNGLRAVFSEQQEYYSSNNAYYATGATCTDSTMAINNTLFSGKNVLDSTFYTFCITQADSESFLVQAVERDGGATYTLDEDNNIGGF